MRAQVHSMQFDPNVSFSGLLDLEPTDTASKSTSHKVKEALHNGGRGNLKLTCGGLRTVIEKDSKVVVVHKYFTEVDDSILGAIFYLQMKRQDKQQVSWLAD